jgi:hypothetical protein
LTCCNQVDQIVFEQQRRARQHRQSDVRLIGRQGVNNDPRCVLIGGERLGKRPPHQRRRIVQQHDHGAFGCGAIV